MTRFLLGLIAALFIALPAAAQLPAGGIAVGKTPITGGTNGLCLYQSAGKVGEQACGSGTATDITVATTTITGGTASGILWKNAGVLAAGPATTDTSGNLNGQSATLSGGTVTASSPVISGAQTWNSGAVVFTGLLINVTNTASSSSSLLLDLQVGGASQINVNRSGSLSSAGSLTALNSITAGSGSNFAWNGRSRMSSAVNGNILLANSGATDFGLLQFGLTTSSAPALKRSTTSLQVRLADDSAYGAFDALSYSAGGVAGKTCTVVTAAATITITGGIVTALTGC